MLKFLKRLGSSWWLLVLLVFCTIIQVFMDFSLPTCLGRIITMLEDGSGIRDIFATSFEMVLIALLSGISSICVGKLASIVTAKMMARVRYEVFAKVSDFSTNEMNKFSISSLITRTTNDITNVSNTFNFAFRYILYGPFLAIAALIFLMRQGSLEMTLLVLGAVILLGIVMFILIKVAIPRYRSIQEKTDHVNLVTRENLEGLRVVRAYNAEKYQEEKFEKVNDDLMRTDRFASRALGFLSPAIMFIVGSLNVG